MIAYSLITLVIWDFLYTYWMIAYSFIGLVIWDFSCVFDDVFILLMMIHIFCFFSDICDINYI